MKFTASRNQLLSALSAIMGAVEKRNNLPILSHVLLEAKDDQLHLTGTDLEMQMEVSEAMTIGSPGSAAISARKLHDICKGLPEGAEITVDVSEKATVKSGRSRFQLSTLNPSEFPRMTLAGDEQALIMTAGQLKELLDRTSFAMAQNDIRYYLNGLLFEADGKYARAVATNGHRLAMAQIDLAATLTRTISIIIPRKAIMELSRLVAAGGDEPLTLAAVYGQISVTIVGLTMMTKLIDGRFPDWERVVPEANGRGIEMQSADMINALSRCTILANKHNNVRFTSGDGTIQLEAVCDDQETAVEEVAAENRGDPVDTGFNAAYLMDALKAVGDQPAMIEAGAERAALIYPKSGPMAKYVVMPVRL